MNSARESEMIELLSRIFGVPSKDLPVGIGDDGAVLARPDSQIVACADMAVEGIHFKREWSTPREIGAKLTAANLADVYAMGALPTYLLVTASLPTDFGISDLEELALGIHGEAIKVNAIVVGGDLSSGSHLTISITALGEFENGATAIRRNGARVGDVVVVSGLPGKSAAGLTSLNTGLTQVGIEFIAHHKKPNVDYSAARVLAKLPVNSMIDISDGLLSEARHLANASGVAIEIDSTLLQNSPEFLQLESTAKELGVDVWDWILTGGEDHLFLATTAHTPPAGCLVIGRVIEGTGVHLHGVSLRSNFGYSHFTS